MAAVSEEQLTELISALYELPAADLESLLGLTQLREEQLQQLAKLPPREMDFYLKFARYKPQELQQFARIATLFSPNNSDPHRNSPEDQDKPKRSRRGGRRGGASRRDGCHPGKFKTKLCKHYQDTGTCPYGRNCAFAHGVHELITPASQPEPDPITQIGLKNRMGTNRGQGGYRQQEGHRSMDSYSHSRNDASASSSSSSSWGTLLAQSQEVQSQRNQFPRAQQPQQSNDGGNTAVALQALIHSLRASR